VIGLPNPWVILAVLIALGGSYKYGHHNGWWDRDAEMQAEIAKKNEEARETERKLTEQLNSQAAKLQEANNVVTEKQTALDRAIRAGRVRLPSASCVQSTPSSPAPSGPPEGTTESDRETLLAIAQIAADGDRAINQLNACIDAYNAVREQINGNR